MKLYSTNNYDNVVDLKEAVLNAFPKDRGLYLPTEINSLPKDFFNNISNYSFQEICKIVTKHLLAGSLTDKEIEGLIDKTFTFPVVLKLIDQNISCLELFHGPTMAFKDFGARFMANLMSLFLSKSDKKTTILVATSGDTGGAVASGFYDKDNIDVIVLYPSGKVSPLQEKQLTSWGKNIKAIEVEGVFDDCQRMVKSAFIDPELKSKYNFSSANSINIARLIPQSFYYFEAYKQSEKSGQKLIFSVPSGNFGNLTAGVLAKRLGLPIEGFIAAVNANKTFHDYLQTGVYTAKPSVSTLSNAMDVGDPSNFERLRELYCSTWNLIKKDIISYHYDDDQTRKAIAMTYNNCGYISDPHGALAYLACLEHQKTHSDSFQYIFLETAHPAKFLETVQPLIDSDLLLPDQLAKFSNAKKESTSCSTDYVEFKRILLDM